MSFSVQSQIGTDTLAVETGKLAQQANGSVLIRYGDSVVLVAATMSKPREGIDFFPLTIDFEERLYARGKIPGSFFRREGRPSTEAILSDRLTDRPLRPLFPKGFGNEVQVIATTLSSDQERPLDLLSIIGSSCALSISDIPFGGPIGATRVGYVGDRFVINPTYQELEESRLDLVVAGTRAGVMMMEAGAREVSEDLVLEGIFRAQEVNLEVVALQEELVRSAGKPKVEFETETHTTEVGTQVSEAIGSRLDELLGVTMGKADQRERIKELKSEVAEKLHEQHEPADVAEAFEALLENTFRRRILQEGHRPDGRGLKEIRPLSSEVGLLPRTHGSGLFSRGETQVLGVATLGSVGAAQKLDTLSPEESKRFMLHYNFPPFSTGEVKRVGTPKRRDIGHGALAERALEPVLPGQDEFPYTIRLVAEVVSSNGSTSMGSVCASTLALMDAGVPIKAPVAGISIGLVTGEGGEFVTLTDIQGMEDHFGDMDFKVAGTAEGITAIQLDIKVESIGRDVMEAALSQAKEARLAILKSIEETIHAPRTEMSPYAPRMTSIKVPVDKIGAVIGPGGKTIRGIVEETKATVDVQDDGTVLIGSTDEAAAARAIEIIEGLTREAKIGEIFTGKVVRVMDFGAFVEIMPGKDGMVHISELAEHRVPSVEDVVKVGEEITVVVIRVDPSGKIALSRRALLEDERRRETGESGPPDQVGDQPDLQRGPPSGGPGPGNSGPRGDGNPSGYRQGQRPQSGGGMRSGPRPPGPRDRR